MTPYKILKKQKLPPKTAGRADGPLGMALRALDVLDCFDYPHGNPTSVYAAAKRLGVNVTLRRTGPKCWRVWRVS